jgi:nucleotide-binding universal stress UspA family protein
MFSRVLFPTDFSAYANTVFACLPHLQVIGVREIVLLSVIRPVDVPLPETYNRESLEHWRWSLGEKLNIARMALERKKLRVRTRVEYGNPVKTILRVAEEEGVEMIVINAQGLTAAQELLIGSVAYDVVRRARLPTLLIKVEVVREMGHIRCRFACAEMFKRVLFPTDFSECAEAAFQLVKDLRNAGTCEVYVLHVQDERVMKLRPREQLTEFDRHDAARLEALCQILATSGMEAHPILRHGIPFREALAVAEEINPGLIVLGAQGYSAVREMLAGSTFENLIRLSRQPVLAVRWQEKIG